MTPRTLAVAFLLLATLAPMDLPAAGAAGGALAVTVSFEQDAYGLAEATFEGVAGLVTVADASGAPVPDAGVRVAIIRHTPLGYVGNETIEGRTAADGTFTFEAGDESRLPGRYVVMAFVRAGDAAAIADDEYSIRAL